MPKPATATKTKPRLIMAFDFGSKRHGVAMGNELTATATPLTEIPAQDGIPAWQLLDQLVAEWQPDIFVVGLPLAEDLSETPLSLRARKFARRLFGRYGKACYGMNERGSTRQAKALVNEHGKHQGNYRQDPVDKLAAAVILESWLQLSTQQANPYTQQQIAGPDYSKATAGLTTC